MIKSKVKQLHNGIRGYINWPFQIRFCKTPIMEQTKVLSVQGKMNKSNNTSNNNKKRKKEKKKRKKEKRIQTKQKTEDASAIFVIII